MTLSRLPLRSRLHARGDRRGVALMVVVAALMILIVLMTDISFASRVRFLTAEHEKQESQAYYLARSGVDIYRLVLTANKALNKTIKSLTGNNPDLAAMMSGMGLGNDALWNMVPFVNTGLLRMLLVSDGGDIEEDDAESFKSSGQVSEDVAEESREDGGGSMFSGRNFLDFDGDFSVESRGEDCRINVNAFSSLASGQAVQDTPTGQMLYGLLSGEENDQWLRERNLDKWELIGNLADWVDADNVSSTGRGGYEDELYNKLDPPYLAKNAKFDTPAEVRLVDGWQDEVYDRFSPSITIFGTDKVNVNCADDAVLVGLFNAYVTSGNADLSAQILTQMREAMTLHTFGTANEVVEWLKSAGYSPSEDLAKRLSVSTTYFTLVSTGQAGDAAVRITVALEYKNEIGKVLYWRVD